MGDFNEEFKEQLKVQSWTLYGIGIFFILLRLYARAHRSGGIINYQFDDYLMMIAGCLYTTLIACLNTTAQGGGSNLYPPALNGTFTALEIEERIFGSKLVVISEQAMLNCIYIIKICMLILYQRLTLGLMQRKAVFYLAVYVAMGWMASEITFFTACIPFEGYWGMPPPNPQCTTLQHYAIVTGCFNISSDLLMLGIPIPLILRISLPWRQKAVLGLVFGMGIFVIVAALLTKVFNLSNIWDPSYMLWYVREASVAIYVSNLPMIWPLLREWFPFLKTLSPGSYLPGSKGQPPRRTHRIAGKPSSSSNDSSGLNRPPTMTHWQQQQQQQPSRRHSLDSFDFHNNDMPVYAGASSTSAEAAAAAACVDDGRRVVPRDMIGLAATCDTREQEHVVGRIGLERTIVMERQAGEIQIERTIVIEEEEARGDEFVGQGWERKGFVVHTVDAEACRSR
ncbi:hypothetical protein F4778DRAFT_479071 [Xylariomycetidae sp. FL2044]|nr:hypothetical protein F4778DRAFT_479071 [Xylariomycetidae sp. FL2044]